MYSAAKPFRPRMAGEAFDRDDPVSKAAGDLVKNASTKADSDEQSNAAATGVQNSAPTESVNADTSWHSNYNTIDNQSLDGLDQDLVRQAQQGASWGSKDRARYDALLKGGQRHRR